MALKAYTFGEWAPDLAQNKTDALVTLTNAFPVANGYAPVPSFGAITPALAAAFKGGAAFVASDGTASLLSGTATNLYRFSGGSWASLIGSRSGARWYFDQFGDNIMCADGGTLVSYDAVAGTAAEIGAAPTCVDVATVRDFVFVVEPGGDELLVQWSAFNDSTGWTPGTNQSGTQPLLSGGKGVKVIGGETGLILQANAIKRVTYVGDDLVFQFDEISGEVGCMARGSVARVGQFVFFLSERGFMVSDRNSVEPIGAEKVDRTFFASYSRADIDNITAAVDPRRHLVMWGMPGSPGTIWCYNWLLKRWSTIETSLAGIFTGFTANVALDALDALYPSGLDSIPLSLDDPSFSGGNPLLLVANASNVVGALSGANLAATFKLPNVEPFPGQRARVRSVRPITDASECSATIDAKARAGDAENLKAAASMRNNGEMPIRANGRYLGTTFSITAAASWTFAQGVEMFCEPAGVR